MSRRAYWVATASSLGAEAAARARACHRAAAAAGAISGSTCPRGARRRAAHLPQVGARGRSLAPPPPLGDLVAAWQSSAISTHVVVFVFS